MPHRNMQNTAFHPWDWNSWLWPPLSTPSHTSSPFTFYFFYLYFRFELLGNPLDLNEHLLDVQNNICSSVHLLNQLFLWIFSFCFLKFPCIINHSSWKYKHYKTYMYICLFGILFAGIIRLNIRFFSLKQGPNPPSPNHADTLNPSKKGKNRAPPC